MWLEMETSSENPRNCWEPVRASLATTLSVKTSVNAKKRDDSAISSQASYHNILWWGKGSETIMRTP